MLSIWSTLQNYAPEIFVLDGPQDVPDTALIEASKRKEEASMEVDEDEDKDSREETGKMQ